MVKMERIIVLLSLYHFCLTSAATHSLQYFYTATLGIQDCPEFVCVGMVDGEPFCFYDNNIRRMVPRQEWAEQAMNQQAWDRNTETARREQQRFKDEIANAMQNFSQTGGIHTLQNMHGCQWDEKTGRTEGYDQYGYDGEDFLTFDVNKMRWNAKVPQAYQTKLKWDSNSVQTENRKKFLTEDCIHWLKKYVYYQKTARHKKVPLEVTLLQKDPSSPVTCHATGFYPRAVNVSWQRDGEDLHEDVELGETLPNGDGTFQKRRTLRISPEDLNKHNYTCTVQHSSLQQDCIKNLNEEEIRRNADQENDPPVAVIMSVVVTALFLLVTAVIGFTVWRRKSGCREANTGA